MRKRRGLIRVGCVLCAALCLTSCSLVDKLGFDTYDYMSEKVRAVHEVDSDLALQLEEFLDILITDSMTLETFDTMNDAIRLYRDAVLTYMLETGYSKYSGNKDLIEKAEEAYPGYHITQIIPKDEFEATMYRCFGGNVMITHQDSARFKYLDKVGAYISPVTLTTDGLKADVKALYETEKTYRVRFVVEDGVTSSVEYFALIIKREDGTLYIKRLMESTVVSE